MTRVANEAQRQRRSTAAANAAKAAGARRTWADPVVRARRVAGMIAAWDDPLHNALRRRDVCRAGHDLTLKRARRGDNGEGCRLCYNARCREGYHRKKERQGVVLFALLIRAAFFRGEKCSTH